LADSDAVTGSIASAGRRDHPRPASSAVAEAPIFAWVLPAIRALRAAVAGGLG
jgi:hypothetical protein